MSCSRLHWHLTAEGGNQHERHRPSYLRGWIISDSLCQLSSAHGVRQGSGERALRHGAGGRALEILLTQLKYCYHVWAFFADLPPRVWRVVEAGRARASGWGCVGQLEDLCGSPAATVVDGIYFTPKCL